MKTEQLYCHECKEKKKHRLAGFMPTFFTREETGGTWEKVAVCVECGGITPQAVTSEEIEQAHERYLGILVEEGVISEQRKQEVLD